MVDEIVNRVANSGLINLDLSDYAPAKTFDEIDLKQFLFESFILKEKEFRNTLKAFDLSAYENKVVAVNCSSDCIIPMWAFMLITSHLNNVASEIHFGTKNEVFQKLFLQNIESITPDEFEDKKVMIRMIHNQSNCSSCEPLPISRWAIFSSLSFKEKFVS